MKTGKFVLYIFGMNCVKKKLTCPAGSVLENLNYEFVFPAILIKINFLI